MPTKPVTATQMSRYPRVKIEGGLSFFTLVLADRRSDLLVRHIERLRLAHAGVERRLPFTTVAICILPDHIHALWQLPDGPAKDLSNKGAAMMRVLLATAAILLLADYSYAQAPDMDPMQCEQLKQAVAQYGYAAARRHAMANYGPEAVRAGDKCLAQTDGTRRRHTINRTRH